MFLFRQTRKTEVHHEIDLLEDQIRECFGRVVYTHKTHEKMADASRLTLWRFKVAQVGTSALTASGALAVIFLDEAWLKITTAIVSAIGLVASAYMRGFDPGGLAQKHRDTAVKLWDVRETYLSLLTDVRGMSLGADEIRFRRDELQKVLAGIYRTAPHTTDKGYLSAQKALKENEEFTFSVDEINAFLPAKLHKAAEPMQAAS